MKGYSFTTQTDEAPKKMDTLKENYNYLSSEVNEYYSTNAIIKKIENMDYEYSFLNDEVEKYSALYEGGSITRSTYDKIIHNRDVAKIQLDELESSAENQYEQLKHERDSVKMQIKEIESEMNGINGQINEMVLVAPNSGIVRKLYYEVGDLAIMAKPFAVIDKEGDLVVKVDIAESDLKKLNKDTKTFIKIMDELSCEVQIRRFPTSINPDTRIGEVEIVIPKDVQDIDILIGSSAEITFVVEEVSGDIILPYDAVKSQGDDNFVYVIEEGIARQRIVELGISFEEKVQVISGIESGEEIAYENLSKLYEGAKVFIFKGDQ